MASIDELLEQLESMELTDDDKQLFLERLKRSTKSRRKMDVEHDVGNDIKNDEIVDEHKIIQEDKLMRYVGIPGYTGLVKYNGLDVKKYTGNSLCLKYDDDRYKLLSNEKIMENIHQYMHGLKNYDNILIAGGFISNIIINNRFGLENNDIDIFIYGLTPEQAEEKVEELVEHFQNGLIIRNENMIMCGRFQIILRCYTSISEILHGFDLGSSAVGFDGKNIWMTKLAQYCYKHGVNIVDLSRRSTTYEYRLIKYFRRGFDIVIPGIKKDNYKYGDLPYLEKFYSKPKGCIVDRRNVNLSERYSDYGDVTIGPQYSNLSYLIGTGKHLYYYGYETLQKTTNTISEEFIRFAYQRLTVYFDEQKFIVKKFKKYLPDYNIIQIINMTKDEFTQVVERQIETALAKLKQIKRIRHVELVWRVDSPGSQLIGSFNPALIEWSEWYKPINPMTEL